MASPFRNSKISDDLCLSEINPNDSIPLGVKPLHGGRSHAGRSASDDYDARLTHR
jgi:hypothetical protein